MKYLIILLWLILGIIYFWLWNSKKTECCNEAGIDSGMAVNSDTSDTKTLGKLSLPLAFNWDSQLAVKGEGFDAYRDSISSSLKEDEILEITGYYRLSEKNTTGEENLGIARAKEVRKLFPEIPDTRIRLLSSVIDEKTGERENLFVSAMFNNALNQKQVKEIANTALIYFPTNSVNKLNSTEIENYLDDVAERVNESGEKVVLTGHTDDVGPADANKNLGQRRSDMIKKYLLTKKVPAAQVSSASLGENQPFVPNTSSENRAKNRRVELKIVNK